MDDKLEFEAQLRRTVEEVQRIQARYRKMVRRAMVYPALVLLMAVAAVAVLSVTAMPGIEAAYKEQGIEVPLMTRPFVALSHLLR